MLTIALACSLTAFATDTSAPMLELTFNRTGTDASSVTVTASGIEGVTATLASVSPTPLAAFGSDAICPEVNGKDSPTIVFEFSIAGLPSEFTFDQIVMKTHAFNSSGANQMPNDNVNPRQYNLSIETNGAAFASLTNMDIAAGNENGIINWKIKSAQTVTSADPLTLKLTVTKGDENRGCFFGLEGLTLATALKPNPNPGDNTESKIYAISWQTGNQLFMAQTSTGGIQVGNNNPTRMMFWEFIPTGNENCCYIRNTASGLYIGSCNLTPSSASKVQMSETPVEYYVGKTKGTGNLINNCYWLSSTDCDYHDNESNSARCLNKDGASSNVITWTNGTGNVGSYWTLTETEDLYEPQPFVPSAEVGTPLGIYHLIAPDGRSYTADGEWATKTENELHRWYFVGENNTAGGYQIVAVKGHTPVNGGQQYTIDSAPGGARYQFFNGDETLELDGVSEFAIVPARTDFALQNHIYNMPCGSTSSVYITKLKIGDEFNYPMATVNNGKVTYPEASKPTNKYVILSKDAAIVQNGSENPLTITFNTNPGEANKIILFIDWNRDGVFEYSQPLTSAKTIETTINVPEDAPNGITRARIRISDNGLNDAEDDVHGEVLDLRLNVISFHSELGFPVITVNDPKRGEAAWAEGIATATPKGNALFLYWKDGVRVASTSASFEVAPSPVERYLMAVFSPNTKLDNEEDSLARIELKIGTISVKGNTIYVNSDYEVKRIIVFALDGTAVASGVATDTLETALPSGIYIAKAITAGGTITSKIQF